MSTKALSVLPLMALLAACGGGGGGTVATGPSTQPLASVNGNQIVSPVRYTSAGHPCNQNPDVMGDLSLTVPDTGNPYGCTIANSPVQDGTQSLRFEVRPDDCFGDDCATDRSRFEIFESTSAPSQGQLVNYRTYLYIPSQSSLKPPGPNALFLSQINLQNASGLYHTLAYLEVVDGNQLVVRTHQGFTWTIKNKYPVASSIFDRWFKIDYQVKASTGAGHLKVWVDDRPVVAEDIPTLTTPSDFISLKVGIYNAFKSQASAPYGNQVIYYDGIRKEIGQ